MSTKFIITTLIEITASVLLIYGYIHEEKLIDFEQALKRILVGHYRRFKRKMLNRMIDRKVLKLKQNNGLKVRQHNDNAN